MAETRRKFDQDFKDGAVRIVRETGKPIAQVARELGINDGTLANWVGRDRRARGRQRDAERDRTGGTAPAAQGVRGAGDGA